jgi:cytochrome c553
MARLLIFLFFLAGLAFIMNLNHEKSDKPLAKPERFNFDKAKEAHEKKVAELEKLKNPKPVEKKVEVVVQKGPLVELVSDELKRGHDLYAKCILCHGKRGEGKKSQKAPAVGGQFEWYLKTQITNMRDGVRINKVMNPYVRKLSDQDIADLSLYMSKLPYMGK